MNLEKSAAALGRVGASAASLLKVALRSRRVSAPGAARPRPLAVLANGPSLRPLLDGDRAALEGCDLMTVNFAPNTPQFFELRPQWLVLADPHFFDGLSDPNVVRLWESLSRVDWPLALCVPAGRRQLAASRLPGCVRLLTFNLTPAEGLDAVSHWLYRRGLAMPRPRNVLIAALMVALRQGYRDIRIFGADHTWSRSLWVDDQNRVVSVQPHFYEDRKDELDRVAAEYAGYHLHDILRSLTVAFESYWRIARWARSLGAVIVNCTPGSMIDAFDRLDPGRQES